MKVPPDRRRFVTAREDRFRIQSPDAHQGITDPDPGVSHTPPVAPEEKEADAPTSASLKLPAQAPEPATRESPPVKPPSNSYLLRTWEASPRAQPGFTSRATVLLALAGLALGGIGGALLSSRGNPAARPAAGHGSQEDVTLLTPEDENALDAAYAARHEEKFAQAKQLFTDLARRHPRWDTLAVEVGRTLLYEQDVPEAHNVLRKAAAQGLAPAEANFLLGALAVMRKSFVEAEVHLATAVALDPTRADFYFFWGECLRREGKPQEAVGKFHSAMLRNQYETSDGLYRLKYWLSEIEADRENSDGVSAEIDAALARSRPSMEALFAAAARDLKVGDIAAAGGHLSRGRESVESSVFIIIMRDPIFTQERSRPELAAFFPAAVPGSRRSPTPAAGSPTPVVQGAASPAKSD